MDTSQLRSYIVNNKAGMIELDLNGQDLRVLPTELFECPKVQVVKVSSNKLREIPKSISSLRQLRVLQASNNFLTCLPETLVNCTCLTDLDLENNRLTSLPVNLGLLDHLQNLKLGQNQLESLTNEIGFLENLRDLDLHGNKLWYLPFSLGNLHKLRQMNVSDNLFEHLPMPVCRIRSLVVLNLSGNHLISLAPDFENLRNLKELNLALNRLKVVPPAVCQMKELRYLNLAANQLTSLPSQLTKLPKLQVLHAQQNYLETLPEEMNNLCYLNVSQNHLRNFSVAGMKRLKYLNASKNLLDNTPMALFNLSKLEHLKLNSNQITFLSQDIVLLKNLKTLDLGNNRLTNLPQVINELQHLTFFNIKGNSVNSRLHPIISKEGQRDLSEGVDGNVLPRQNRAKNVGYATVTNPKDLHKIIPKMVHSKLDSAASKTKGQRARMWSQDKQATGHREGMWAQDDQTIDHRAGKWAQDDQTIDHREGMWAQDDQTINHRLGMWAQDDQTIDHRAGMWAQDDQTIDHRAGMWAQDDQTIDHRAGMWAQDELLQDGFSQNLLRDSQSCVITENNYNFEGPEKNIPYEHYDQKDFRQGRYQISRSNPDIFHMWEDDLPGADRVITKGKGSYSIRQHMKGRLSRRPKFRKEIVHDDTIQGSNNNNTMSQARTQANREHRDYQTASRKELMNLKSTNLNDAISPSMESLSSTDFKLLGVCSQLEAMLNEELLHPVLTHPGSISKNFKGKSIIKDENGMWRLSKRGNPNQDELAPEQNPTDTLHLRSATPSRRRLVNGHGATFSPGKYRKKREPLPMEAWGKNLNEAAMVHSKASRSPQIRRQANTTDADFWHPSISPPATIRRSKPVDTKLFYPEHTGHADFIQDFQNFPCPPIHTRSNIDRFLLSHQGRACTSSVDSKVVVMVPQNGASGPAYLMMQLERISDETLEGGRKDHELIENIVSMSPILHLTTSKTIECHGMVTMTIPTPPGAKKRKLHLLTVRADNSCIPCTAGYHIKNSYLTLQTSQLSGKVVVCTKAKCKYKACKSVEQLLQFHYI